MARVLLAGESWISQSTHYKGFDSFSSTTFETGADDFIPAAASQGIEIEQIYAHDVPRKFPRTVEALSPYDVVILSDIGYNSFVLPNEVWLRGERTMPFGPNVVLRRSAIAMAPMMDDLTF